MRSRTFDLVLMSRGKVSHLHWQTYTSSRTLTHAHHRASKQWSLSDKYVVCWHRTNQTWKTNPSHAPSTGEELLCWKAYPIFWVSVCVDSMRCWNGVEWLFTVGCHIDVITSLSSPTASLYTSWHDSNMTHSLRTSLHTSAHELSLVFLLNNVIVYYLTRTSLSTGVHKSWKGRSMRWPEKKLNFPAAVLLPFLSCMCAFLSNETFTSKVWKIAGREKTFSTWEAMLPLIAYQLWEGSLTACLVTWLS